MATFNSTLYDAQKPTRTNTTRLADPNKASGSVEFAVIPYTCAGTEAAADIINLCILPAGIIPVPQLSSITSVDPSANTLVIDVGTAEDADGWGRSVNQAAGGQNGFTSGGVAALPAWLAPTAIAADTGSGNVVVFATIATASGVPDAGDVLYFLLAYKRGR